ncbi:MAG: LLM class flavin-dependent oxidoreductase [Candidatus Tectomicrobia bacterium]|nr:LLM class flavin-dependent oxidoreductase [Candidatus Tectomicrobia bacterium]
MAERKVKLGVLLPTRGVLLWNRGVPEIGPIVDLAVRAEELGYDSVFVGDSVLAKPRLEALSVLSALAVKTRRVKLGTAVFLPCLRDPVFLAYQVATLDVISGGRVILGVGIGPPKPQECEHEFETLGVPFRKRMFYLQERMTLMRRLWTEDAGAQADPAPRPHVDRLGHRRYGLAAGRPLRGRLVPQPADPRGVPGHVGEDPGRGPLPRPRPGRPRLVHDHLPRRQQGEGDEERGGVPPRLLLHPLLG